MCRDILREYVRVDHGRMKKRRNGGMEEERNVGGDDAKKPRQWKRGGRERTDVPMHMGDRLNDVPRYKDATNKAQGKDAGRHINCDRMR